MDSSVEIQKFMTWNVYMNRNCFFTYWFLWLFHFIIIVVDLFLYLIYKWDIIINMYV